MVSKTRKDESEQLEAKLLPWGRRKKAPRCQRWDPTLGVTTSRFSRGERASPGAVLGFRAPQTPLPPALGAGYPQLPLGDVNLFAAVLCYVPKGTGGVLVLSHFASVGFPASFNFFIRSFGCCSRQRWLYGKQKKPSLYF